MREGSWPPSADPWVSGAQVAPPLGAPGAAPPAIGPMPGLFVPSLRPAGPPPTQWLPDGQAEVRRGPPGGAIGWLLFAAVALLSAGLFVNQSTTAFFTDTRVVSGNNFVTASVALNETPFTAFAFEKFVPGDVFVRPVAVTNSTASNAGAVNVNYFMTIKDNFSNCSTQDPACADASGSLSDPVTGLRLVAIRCFSDVTGMENVACESGALRSVRLVKGVMETIWPGGATNAVPDLAGIVRDRNETAQYGNVGGTGSERADAFAGLPNGGDASDYFGRPIVFGQAGALSTQPLSVKVNPARASTSPPAQLGSVQSTNAARPVVQGSDVLRIGGTRQDLDGNWARAVRPDGGPSSVDACGDIKVSAYGTMAPDLAGCGAEVVGVPFQTLSNPNCNGVASAAPNRAVANATGNPGSVSGPGANADVGVTPIAVAGGRTSVFSTQSHGACLMGGPDFEKNAPIVLSPRLNNQLMAAGGGETPRIVSDVPAQSLADEANTIAGLGAGRSDNLALIVYLPSWSAQSSQSEAGATTLKVPTRQAVDSQNNPVSLPTGGAGGKDGAKGSYTVAFTAVQPVGQTFALANVAQQSANILQALAGQVLSNPVPFTVQATDNPDLGTVATLLDGAIQSISPNVVTPGARQVVTVTGRGFARVTAIPQGVRAEGSTSGGGSLGDGTHRYVVVASTSDVIDVPADSPPYMTAPRQSWVQGEPSAEVSVSLSSAGRVTVSWSHVAGASHYQVYRDLVRDASGTVTGGTRITVEYGAAAGRSTPDEAGWISGGTVSVLDAGNAPPTNCATTLSTTGCWADDAATTFPVAGRPCLKYAPAASFGMCPGLEILPSGAITVADPGECARLNPRSLNARTPNPCAPDVPPVAFVVGTGEVFAATGGVARSGDGGQSAAYQRGTVSGVLQSDRALISDPVRSAQQLGFAIDATAGEDTVGVVSANQVTFGLFAVPLLPGQPQKVGLRITNPNHPSLPLDVRGKVMVAPDSVTLQPQTVAEYAPSSVGRISEGNTLVVKGTGFQKGAIVHLGYYVADPTSYDPVTGVANCNLSGPAIEPNPTTSAAVVGRVLAKEAFAGESQAACFVSKSHIRNRAGETLTTLGTEYATGYDADFPAPTGSLLVGATGLWAKEAQAIPNSSCPSPATPNCKVPWFSYDHTMVTVNTSEQLTIKNVTVTNVISAPVGVAVKVFNPDGSVVFGRTFGIAAPGIEQIVQIDAAGKPWLSAPQGQIVTMQFRASAPQTFVTSSTGLAPTVVPACYDSVYDANLVVPGLSTPGGWKASDPCIDAATGAARVGVTQVGDLKVVDDGRAVEGRFAIASDAQVGLRRFTMTNGDGAVFSNFFAVSQAPTVVRLTYPGGASRMVADGVSSAATGGGSLAQSALARFDVEGALPRGSRRRVLITGSGFVRGSFGSMRDPLPSAPSGTTVDLAAVNATCAGTAFRPNATGQYAGQYCFGWRSDLPLAGAETGVDAVATITFSNSGVRVVAGTTAVVKDDGASLSMVSSVGQGASGADAFVATRRVTAVIEVSPTAPAGPVTMTVTNPDGGQAVVPNAFTVNGAPTLDVATDGSLPVGGTAVSRVSDATIAQGQSKAGAAAIFLYGSGFFQGSGQQYLDPNNTASAPQVATSGTGLRITRVTLGQAGVVTLTPSSNDDNEMFDTVLRVELEAEATATPGLRDVTVTLPDGQSVVLRNGIEVVRPGGRRT